MALNIMVLESEHGAADDAIRELTDAGHVVLRYHDPGAPAFPCRGIETMSACPVEVSNHVSRLRKGLGPKQLLNPAQSRRVRL
jgi:hypothetical protein